MRSAMIDKLKVLHLPGFAENLELRLQEARGNRLDFEEFLEILIDDELAMRQAKKRKNALKKANFRDLKTLEDFDWQFNPNIDRNLFYQLANCQFIREPRDLLCIGAPGTGKSHLTQAIGYEAVKRGFAVIYSSIFDLIREFQYPELGKEKAILTKYLKCDLLIIDDMGLKSLPDRAGEILFELIMRRYELRSTIMTSNRPIEDWGKLIGDVATAGAISDRLLQNAMVIPFKGRSYRLRKAAGEL